MDAPVRSGRQSGASLSGRVLMRPVDFSERDVVWQSWDAGIIEGDDLVTAIILGRQLIRIRLIAQTDTIRLETVAGPLGISPDGIYLGAHDCALMPVSVKPADMSGRNSIIRPLRGSRRCFRIPIIPTRGREYLKWN